MMPAVVARMFSPYGMRLPVSVCPRPDINPFSKNQMGRRFIAIAITRQIYAGEKSIGMKPDFAALYDSVVSDQLALRLKDLCCSNSCFIAD